MTSIIPYVGYACQIACRSITSPLRYCMRISGIIFSFVLLFAARQATAQDHDAADHASPYIGFEGRSIASLSPEDIDELLAGGGWGLALPAELNGLPGPRHVLDMVDELGLSDEQRMRTQAIFDSMKSEAVELGRRFVEREREVDAYFERIAAGKIVGDPDRLKALVDSSGAARSTLRTVHLGAHLQMMDVLTPEQVEAYVRLRGYSADDPCANVPEGHDPAMWRTHNNCDG